MIGFWVRSSYLDICLQLFSLRCNESKNRIDTESRCLNGSISKHFFPIKGLEWISQIQRTETAHLPKHLTGSPSQTNDMTNSQKDQRSFLKIPLFSRRQQQGPYLSKWTVIVQNKQSCGLDLVQSQKSGCDAKRGVLSIFVNIKPSKFQCCVDLWMPFCFGTSLSFSFKNTHCPAERLPLQT